ncbi:MAG: type II toxin-antitoxin system VapC family toxin [Halochromatium sp.]
MILFCDTSALIKLYIHESYTEQMLAAAAAASTLAVCRIAWAEAMAALARRSRESPPDVDLIETVRHRLRADWCDYAVVEVTQKLVELAGDYADAFALRGYDSVQLAAARTLSEVSNEPVQFACFDRRLENAARVLGLAPA